VEPRLDWARRSQMHTDGHRQDEWLVCVCRLRQCL